MKISYLSECDTDYQKKLEAVETLGNLLELLTEYEPVAHDALDLVKEFDEKRFKALKKSMAKERRGIFSESEDASVVMMPQTMFRLSIISSQFKAPWGTAFIRAKEVGILEEKNGRYYFKPKA